MDEKIRVEQLELFDEHEQWHLKCCHYSFVMATNGAVCREFVNDLLEKNGINGKNSEKINLADSLNEYDRLTSTRSDRLLVKISEFPIRLGVRMGHSVCKLKQKLFVIGGFGESLEDTTGKHKRLTSLEVSDLNNTSSIQVLDAAKNLIGK